MLSLLTKKKKIKSEWRKVSELKAGMQIAVPKKGVLESHNSGLINSREWMGEDDILWDEIESIKHVGKEQVWDIEVDGTHNFVGNDIFAHNTYISGNLGIGESAPSVALDVTGDIEYTGIITDVSDERLKENITPIMDALVKVAGIQGKYFNMKDNPQRVELGFLAQNVKEYVPEAVSTVDPINGYLGVSYSSLIPVAFNAIQELNLNLNAVTGTITPLEGSASETFVKAFFDNVYSKMRTWLASAENGIQDFYANRMRAKELCIGDESGETCITKTQLDTLLANAGMSAVSTSTPSSNDGGTVGGNSSDAVAPVITLNGEAIINLNIGDTYNEEGATALDDVDGNVAVIISGNVDTNTNGSYTITYSATDIAGNNITAIRTVNVVDLSIVTPLLNEGGDGGGEPAPTEEVEPAL